MSALSEEAVSLPNAESWIAAEVKRAGCSSPIPLLSSKELAALERHLGRADLPAPLSWAKGRAVTDPVLHELAARPEIVGSLRPLLGENIILWGASIIARRPGNRHPWHTDMESADADSRVISVWIGIQNSSGGSGLRFIAGSHRFGHPVQEVLAALREDRDTISDERVIEIARSMDPAARLIQPDARDGEMVLFDGHMWHSGYNDRPTGTRLALLLQYAAVETPIPMPAGSGPEWPLRFKGRPRVPTILISGRAHQSVNRVVPPPQRPLEGLPMITTVAKTVALPLSEDPVKRWRPYPQFRGATGALSSMSCHISVLSPGYHPHPPHIHPEEELLLVLDGDVEIELADGPDSTGSSRHPLRPGMFSYYPTTQHHTIHNAAARPATYLMFKWLGAAADTETPLPARIFEYEAAVVTPGPKPIAQKLLFQEGTHALKKLHCHLTTLQPGAEYAAHADPYDVAIVLFSGEVETVGARVRPLGLIYYSAGELHGMKNVGNTPASYLVFEFHSTSHAAPAAHELAEKVTRGIGRRFRKVLRLIKKLGP